MSQVSEIMCKTFKEGDDIRDAGLTTPEDIIRYDGILYGDDPQWQVLDVYRPKASRGTALPVIVSVHGGGWVYGDKERYQYYCMSLAQRGFAVVNFTYRLAPKFKFPAQLEDTNLVFSWVLSHGEEYGFDLAHLFAVGDSAGGNILGLYAAMCTNPEFAKEFPFQPPKGFVPTAVALNCGCYRIPVGKNADPDPQVPNTFPDIMKDLLPGGGTEAELHQLEVPAHITSDYPPTFFMTSTGDMMKTQAPLLEKALLAQNVPFVFRLYGSAKNQLGHVFHCNMKTEDAKHCNDEECRFFQDFC